MLVYAADPGLDLGYLFVSDLVDDEIWRWFATPFLHGDQLGYAFVALVGVGIFGTLFERRFGPVAVVAIFLLAGAAGAGLSVVLETPPLLSDEPIWPVWGANGAALGLLCAWLVDDRLAARRGHDRENDLLGVYVIAAVLVLLSLTSEEANIAAAIGGALTGAVLGLLIPRLTRKA
jgi:membrane associated rhomboid family serine protease